MDLISISDVIEFLCEHETAGEDFCGFFDVDIWEDDIDDLNNKLDPDSVLDWLSDHKQLCRDFLIHAAYMDASDVEKMSFETVVDMLAERMGLIHH